MSVSDAIKAGRLKDTVVRNAAGQPIGISSFILADQEWAKNSNMSKAPLEAQLRNADLAKAAAQAITPTIDDPPEDEPEEPGATPLDAIDAAAREKYWKANTAELKFREMAGELIPAVNVERELIAVFTQAKTRLLAIPSRARQEMPELTLDQVEKLEALVREACDDLARSPGKDAA
jgi:hypothetical protein